MKRDREREKKKKERARDREERVRERARGTFLAKSLRSCHDVVPASPSTLT
jgi:hypothetical protein